MYSNKDKNNAHYLRWKFYIKDKECLVNRSFHWFHTSKRGYIFVLLGRMILLGVNRSKNKSDYEGSTIFF